MLTGLGWAAQAATPQRWAPALALVEKVASLLQEPMNDIADIALRPRDPHCHNCSTYSCCQKRAFSGHAQNGCIRLAAALLVPRGEVPQSERQEPPPMPNKDGCLLRRYRWHSMGDKHGSDIGHASRHVSDIRQERFDDGILHVTERRRIEPAGCQEFDPRFGRMHFLQTPFHNSISQYHSFAVCAPLLRSLPL